MKEVDIKTIEKPYGAWVSIVMRFVSSPYNLAELEDADFGALKHDDKALVRIKLCQAIYQANAPVKCHKRGNKIYLERVSFS